MNPLYLVKRLRATRPWFLGPAAVHEFDTTTHLGIVLSVSRSSLDHTVKCISASRSAFYALQGVGSRFGCLHMTDYFSETVQIHITTYSHFWI